MKNYHVFEIKRFLVKKIKLIVSSAIIFGIALAALGYFKQINAETQEKDVVNDESEVSDYLDSRAAYFRFYLEKPDGDPFRKVGTIQELFTTDEMYEELYRDEQIDLESIEETIREETGQTEFNSIDTFQDDSNNMYVIRFETGENKRNLDLANYYYELLLNGKFEMLNNLNIYSITSPKLVKKVTDAELEEQKISSEKNISLKNIFLYFVIGAIGGTVFIFITLIILELYSKKLNFSFAYIADESNDFIVVDKKLENKMMVGNYVGRPFGNKKIVLSEVSLGKDAKTTLIGNKNNEITFDEIQKNKLTLVEENTLNNIKLMNNYVEVIIVVFPGITTRKWYETQRMLCKLYELPVKTVQLN